VDAAKRIRKKMGIGDDQMLIVASAGGGNVGAPLLKSVVHAFNRMETENSRLQVFSGPFLDQNEFDGLKKMANENLRVDRFTADFLSCLAAADLSVSVGG